MYQLGCKSRAAVSVEMLALQHVTLITHPLGAHIGAVGDGGLALLAKLGACRSVARVSDSNFEAGRSIPSSLSAVSVAVLRSTNRRKGLSSTVVISMRPAMSAA